MAIVTFKSVTFHKGSPGEVFVGFNYQDANDGMTAVSVSKGQAGNVTIFVSDGVTTEQSQNAGFSLAPFGSVLKFTDELGEYVTFPVGLSFLVQYEGPAGFMSVQSGGPGGGK